MGGSGAANGTTVARSPLTGAQVSGVAAPGRRPPTGLAVAVIVMGWTWVAWLVVLGFAADASEETWRHAVERQLTYHDTAASLFDVFYLPVRGFVVATFVVVSIWLHQSRRFAEAYDPGYRYRLAIGS